MAVRFLTDELQPKLIQLATVDNFAVQVFLHNNFQRWLEASLNNSWKTIPITAVSLTCKAIMALPNSFKLTVSSAKMTLRVLNAPTPIKLLIKANSKRTTCIAIRSAKSFDQCSKSRYLFFYRMAVQCFRIHQVVCHRRLEVARKQHQNRQKESLEGR